MKIMISLLLTLVSFNALAGQYVVKDVLCDTFDFYGSKKMCLFIIANAHETAGVLINQKYVKMKVSDEQQTIGTKIAIGLDQLLMLTLEEEANIRNFINYPQASYYSAGQRDFKFLDFYL
jgi:hypothetical protein